MGYCEHVCQLCGVSFAISRIRRPSSPPSSSWDYSGTHYPYAPPCSPSPSSGCTSIPRPDHPNSNDLEHIAGPGCVCTTGYSGYRISVEEMKGAREVVCIVEKGEDWEVDEGEGERKGDEDFEKEGRLFLTGVGEGSPDEAPLIGLRPVRHGVEEVWLWNTVADFDDPPGLPMHPTCFEIWKRISMEKFGRIDLNDLWQWRQIEGTYEHFYTLFPRHPSVRRCGEQWWSHIPGTEWLVANPIDIPGLPLLLNSCYQDHSFGYIASERRHEKIPYDPNQSVAFLYGSLAPKTRTTYHPTDPFPKLPLELKSMLLSYLSYKDIAALRLVSTAFRELPGGLFRDLLMKTYPWIWEIRELEKGKTRWFELWMKVRFGFGWFMGLRNRERIWRDCWEVARRVEGYRKEGRFDEGELGSDFAPEDE